MAWSIRRAVEGDAPRIAEITVAGWRHAYDGVLPAERLAALDVGVITERRREQVAAPAPAALFVASEAGVGAAGEGGDDGAVRGFCIVGTVGDAERDGDPATTGHFQTLYLDPPVIGTGAGSALHDAGVAHLAAAGFRRAILWAFAGNTSALAFYARHGWHHEAGPVQPEGWGAPCERWARAL